MSLKIGVFVKYVPDTSARIRIAGDAIDKSDVKHVLNPYDEYAVEEAVKTRDAWKKAGQEAEIVGICLGPKTAVKALRDAFAVGVDRGVLIIDEEGKANDPLSVSTALASVAKEEGFHLIFAGKQAVDSDGHATAQMVAEHLKMPHISVVSKFELSGTESAKIERDIDGGMKQIFNAKISVTCHL